MARFRASRDSVPDSEAPGSYDRVASEILALRRILTYFSKSPRGAGSGVRHYIYLVLLVITSKCISNVSQHV